MSYKWRPSKSARRDFAQKMNNDPDFKEEYLARDSPPEAATEAGSEASSPTAKDATKDFS